MTAAVRHTLISVSTTVTWSISRPGFYPCALACRITGTEFETAARDSDKQKSRRAPWSDSMKI